MTKSSATFSIVCVLLMLSVVAASDRSPTPIDPNSKEKKSEKGLFS